MLLSKGMAALCRVRHTPAVIQIGTAASRTQPLAAEGASNVPSGFSGSMAHRTRRMASSDVSSGMQTSAQSSLRSGFASQSPLATALKEAPLESGEETLVWDSTDIPHPEGPEGFRIRRAVAADHRAVVNILPVGHSGLDYIDFAYPFIIDSPNFNGCVMETIDGQRVSFACGYCSDCGLMTGFGAARTLPEHRGTGKNTKLIGAVAADLEHQGRLNFEEFEALAVPFMRDPRHVSRFERAGDVYRNLGSRHFQNLSAPLDKILRWAKSPEFQQLKEDFALDQAGRANADQVQDLFQCPDRIAEVFPHYYILSSWIPHPATPMGGQRLYEESVVQMSGATWGRECDAVSFVAPVLCQAGVRFDVAVYGGDDFRLTQHVLKAIEMLGSGQLFSNPDLNVEFVYYYPHTLAVPATVEAILREGGFKSGSWHDKGGLMGLENDTTIQRRVFSPPARQHEASDST